MRMFHFLAAGAAVAAVAAPVAAQSSYPYQSYPVQQSYPQGVPQPYPGQPGYGYGQQAYPGYPQPAYGYGQQGYGQNPVGQMIDQLLGNRYTVTDRQAVSQCASAALNQAAAQYGSGYGAYSQRYGQQYGQGYNRHSAMRVTAITSVQRRNSGLRVSGLMHSGGAYGGNQYAYQNRNYAAGDLSFRCNVDYRGAVTNLRIGRNMAYGR